MEAEIRAILTEAVSPAADPRGFAQTLLARFGDLGGVDLELPSRTELPRAAGSPTTPGPIILDTNVVSELMRAAPDTHVARWVVGVGQPWSTPPR
jgi:hypothetical protein